MASKKTVAHLAPPDAPASVQQLNRVFNEIGIDAVATSVLEVGPLRRFTLELGPRMHKKIDSSGEDIMTRMRAIQEPIVYASRLNGAADGTYRLELMMAQPPTVKFDDLAATCDFKNPQTCKQYNIPILLGAKNITEPLVIDLQAAPHLIVAGVTGSGKTQLLHSIIRSIEVHSKTQGIRLVLIDPKQVDFSAYAESPALRYSIVKSLEGAKETLSDINSDLDKRLALLAKHGCRDILEYRAAGHEMPFIVVVIDELAEFSRDPEFAALLCSIAARSRAGGIHFAVGTQHPVREVITGLLKAQFPTRIVTKTTTATHSRVAIDQNGAERLLGQGDALLLKESGELVRFKGSYSPPAPPKMRPRPNPERTTSTQVGGVLSIFKAVMSLAQQGKTPVRRKRRK